MRACSVATNVLLNSLALTDQPGEVTVEDLYTITLVSGTVIRLTSGPQDRAYGGNTFTSYSSLMYISRGPIKCSVGLVVDTVKITLKASGLAQPFNSISVLAECAEGYWDGASVLIDRLILPKPAVVSAWSSSTTYALAAFVSNGGVNYISVQAANLNNTPSSATTWWQPFSAFSAFVWFKGTIGDFQSLKRSQVTFDVRSKVELLDLPIPRKLMGTGCVHVFGDAGCGLNPATFTFPGTVQAGSNASYIVTNLTQVAAFAPPTTAQWNPASVLSTATPPGVNLNERGEFVVVTYVYPSGETLPSAEAYLAVPGAEILVVQAPTNPGGGCLGWNCYIGAAPGDEQLQTLAYVPFAPTAWSSTTTYAAGETVLYSGTVYMAIPGQTAAQPTNLNRVPSSSPTWWVASFGENVEGFTQGAPPPQLDTSGYFAQGVITFTSGVNNGLSRTIWGYTLVGSNNVIYVVPPFPQSPGAGDSFNALSGDDKRSSTCANKYANFANYLGFDFIPSPDSTV